MAINKKPQPKFKVNDYVYINHITHRIYKRKYLPETDIWYYRVKRDSNFMYFWAEEGQLTKSGFRHEVDLSDITSVFGIKKNK